MGSGGGGGSGNPSLLYQNVSPMPDIPIAGKNSTIGDPYNYGMFQNFLPDPPSDGKHALMATGLTPDMFVYRHPNSTMGPGPSSGGPDTGGGGGNVGGASGDDVASLRAQLAALTAGQGPQGQVFHTPNTLEIPQTPLPATWYGGGG